MAKKYVVNATISSKECAETEHLLGLPKDANFIDSAKYSSIINDCTEILNRLTSTRKTMEQLAGKK